jgi:hypothetical protein
VRWPFRPHVPFPSIGVVSAPGVGLEPIVATNGQSSGPHLPCHEGGWWAWFGLDLRDDG